MIRLTEKKRNPDGTAVSKKSLIDREGKGYPSSYATAIVTKLAEFEDLEELIGVSLNSLISIRASTRFSSSLRLHLNSP